MVKKIIKQNFHQMCKIIILGDLLIHFGKDFILLEYGKT